MKKFKVTVYRKDEYEIEFNDDVYSEEFLKESYYDNLEMHAVHIAQFRARTRRNLIEGYGVPLVNGKVPSMNAEDNVNLQYGLNIDIISEDKEITCEVVELE